MQRRPLLVFLGFLTAQYAYAESVYRHSENDAPRTLDPLLANTGYSNTLVTAIYDTLYEYKYLKRPYELKPNLAEALPIVSSDGLRFLIPLKKGVRFADDACFPGGRGRELPASDVVYSLKRHFDPSLNSAGKWLWQDRIVGLDSWGAQKPAPDYRAEVAGLRAKDRYTVEITLSKPYPQFLYSLAMGFAAIVPHEAVEKYGRELAVHPVGSGPWRLTQFDATKATLVRNPSYREELFDLKLEGYDEREHAFTGIASLAGRRLPLLDRVEVFFMKQQSARWNSFTKTDEVQYAVIPSSHLDEVLSAKQPVTLKPAYARNYHMRVQRELGFVYTEFNMSHPEIGYNPDPERNKRNHALRCAIRKGFDWSSRIKRGYYGIGEPFPGIIPPDVDGYDPSLPKDSILLDVAGAKELLKKHGWTAAKLPSLEYTGVASVNDKQFYEQFRSWMKAIGYPREKIRYTTFASFGDYSKAIKEGRLMAHNMAWSLDYPDAENTLQLYYGPCKSPGSNAANYQNPAYDALYERARTMAPSPERSSLYRQANQFLINDCVTIAGFARTRVHLWHRNVTMYPDAHVIGNYFKYIASGESLAGVRRGGTG